MISGWQLSVIITLQSGTPLYISASNRAGLFLRRTWANNNGQSGKLTTPARERLDRWFETSVFSQPAPFTLGNAGARSSDLRTHGTYNFDLASSKEFHLIEQVRMQFRMEALNAFNTVRFGTPNTSVVAAAFGRVTSQANAPRQIQLGLKLFW